MNHSEDLRFLALVENSSDVLMLMDHAGQISYITPSSQRHLGWLPSEMTGRSILDFVHPDDEELAEERIAEMLQHPGEAIRADVRFKHADLSWRNMEAIGVNRLQESSVSAIVITARDVTERQKLELQLRQAQKMEAVGRLAGGVAHDFNNLLTAILGYCNLMLDEVPAEDPLRKDLDEIRAAGERAAALTRQLLAFSRRQMLQPQKLDFNALVRQMEKMVRRLIGEDVELAVALAEPLSPVVVDPSSIEQILVNLAVNARDAMPMGGRLTLETAMVDLDAAYADSHATVIPGRYAMLAVSDNGAGMDALTRARVFEPFFTTKEQGRGVGLGLATVYGVVKQSGGYIWVYSEPGRGTSFKIYFPEAAGVDDASSDDAKTTAAEGAPEKAKGGTETVLLVEDEDAVRALAGQVLRRYGYVVLEARDGLDALRLAERQQGVIELLITDLVMPHMTGRELAQRLTEARGNMKVLFMSGYTNHAVVHRDLTPGSAFLQKPFTPDSLIRRFGPFWTQNPARAHGSASPSYRHRFCTVSGENASPISVSGRDRSSEAVANRRGARRRHRTHFRGVWAPLAARVDVINAETGAVAVTLAAHDGYFEGIGGLGPGARYWLRLNGGEDRYPDPRRRGFSRKGHTDRPPSWIPLAFEWSDAASPGISLPGQVIYELHVGTFTQQGTWAAAEEELPELAHAGITIIEVMPIAEFQGQFGWGYDGVDLFAPTRLYGEPDDLRRFVDRAHALGIAVILDVVYNHLGPSGNYLRVFSQSYFTDWYENEWGDAINFDGPDAGPVREFFIANAGYWIDEYHFDGLRLDATQQIFDQSPQHILAAVGLRAREAAGRRSIVLVAENERQEAQLVRALEEGGFGLDALWNDDFHHSATVALTGHAEAYYSDTTGHAQEFVSAARHGYLFQGQHYAWQQQPRGTPAFGVPARRFVAFLQNHDQVANSARGERGDQLTSPAKWRAMTALLLLGPWTPMLFQGEEFGASAPFLYFADFDPQLAAAVQVGRAQFLAQFPSVVDYEAKAPLADAGDRRTFDRCKIDRREREANAWIYALHRDLLRIRREHAAFANDGDRQVDGAVLSDRAFVLRFFAPRDQAAEHDRGNGGGDRLLIVNLGRDLARSSFAEPLLAPPAGRDWDVLWSSEHPSYGGVGTRVLWPEWWLPGESALVLSPVPQRPRAPIVSRRTA